MDQVHRYFVGLDLGQVQDYTALAVIEAADTKGAWDPVQLYFRRHRELRLRHLERMPLGRPYPEVVARTGQVMRAGAPEGGALLRELSGMRMEISESGREGWRSGAHDDLVFAVALACWAAKRGRPWVRHYW